MKASIVALFIAIIAPALKIILPWLLPYGRSQIIPASDRVRLGTVDSNLKTLQCGKNSGDGDNGNLVKIFERVKEGKKPVLDGPETVMFDDESNLYALTKGNIVQLTNLETSSEDSRVVMADAIVVAQTVGFPLGGKSNLRKFRNNLKLYIRVKNAHDLNLISPSKLYLQKGKFVPSTKILYFADAVLGLCRIDLSQERPKVELVVSQFQLDDGTISRINYADDVDVGKSGMIYFSDATDIMPERDGKTWDVMNGYKIDLMRSKRTGRLLRYDPVTDKVDILASNIWFANGVAVDEDETFVMISETSMGRLLKYNLVGPDQGKLEVIVDGLPGMVDGADCDKAYCYAPLPSSYPPIMKFLNSLPPFAEAWLKTFLMMLPKSLTPKPVKYGGVVEVTASEDSSSGGSITRFFQDPSGVCMHLITGVTVHDGKLYLGSLEHNFVGVLDLGAPFDNSAPFLIFSNETVEL